MAVNFPATFQAEKLDNAVVRVEHLQHSHNCCVSYYLRTPSIIHALYN